MRTTEHYWTLCMLGNFFCYCLLIFFKITFSKFFQELHHQIVSRLISDQNRLSVGPDLCPNCLWRSQQSSKALAHKNCWNHHYFGEAVKTYFLINETNVWMGSKEDFHFANSGDGLKKGFPLEKSEKCLQRIFL